ncbi:hypothetical protein Pyn_31510 [Prunus yedoensis var. nudiflora]|uniref:Uncharacterized protein n=1 Tax=Prunus yedoensis var. nudiflora TaxID=2094558 RepID=A0A314UDN2_PRUYE|nr:hypothetical protein Pyn_31510 [Prunus yedoensis var. nudiflora]
MVIASKTLNATQAMRDMGGNLSHKDLGLSFFSYKYLPPISGQRVTSNLAIGEGPTGSNPSSPLH